ncbi:MAG: hypothetical protein ACREBR_03920, partial [bacterium]
PALASGLTSALLRQRLPPESFLSDKTLRPTHGDCGKATANHWISTAGCRDAPTQSRYCNIRASVSYRSNLTQRSTCAVSHSGGRASCRGSDVRQHGDR